MRRFRNIWMRISACASVGILLTSCGALWSVSDDSYMYPSGYDYNYGYGPAQPPVVGNGPGSIIPVGGTPPPPPPAYGNGPGSISNPTPPPNNQGFGKPQNPGGNGPQNPIPNLPPAGNNNSGGYRPSIPEGGGNGSGVSTPPPNYGRH